LQKNEFLSLEQGQSETIPGRRDVARAPARQSARAPAPARPSASGPRPRLPEAHAPSPGCPTPLECLGVRPLLAPRAGRRTPNGPPVRSMPPPTVHSSRGRCLLLGVAVGLLGRWQARLSTIKRSPPSCPGHAAAKPPPAPLLAATASSELRSTARQIMPASTFPCPYPNSPTTPSPPTSSPTASTPAAAATRPGRRRRPSSASSLPHPSTGIGPLGPKAPPPPVPSRPQLAVGQNLAGPPLAGAPGTTLQGKKSFRGPHCDLVTQIVK
jgi:hypothetical protein